MALPSNVNFGTVTGRFIDSEGANIEGRVTFTPQPKSLVNVTATPPTTILPRPVTANLSSGAFSVQLIATDDPDNNPAGWTYQVAFNFTGVSLSPFSIEVPQDTTRDLATLIPVASTSGTTIIRGLGVPETANNGDTLIYDTATNQWTAAQPSAGGGVTSYNDLTDKPAIPNTPDDIGAQPAGEYATTTALTSGLSGKSPTSHTHAISDTTGLQSALDAAGGSPAWADVTGKPTTFAPTIGTTGTTAVAGNDTRLTNPRTPTAHTHPTSDVTGLDTALAGKQASGDYATNTALTTGLAGKAASSHTHTIANVTGLQGLLDGKQASGDYALSSALTSGLAGKAATAHTHTIGNVTGLQSALDAKGTSNLTLGTTSSTAKAGNYKPSATDMPSSFGHAVANVTGSEARPTTATGAIVFWVGGTTPPANAITGDVHLKDMV